jgi:hypothetical protein
MNFKAEYINIYSNQNMIFNHPTHVKRGLIQSLHNRAPTRCPDRQDLAKEINKLRVRKLMNKAKLRVEHQIEV